MARGSRSLLTEACIFCQTRTFSSTIRRSINTKSPHRQQAQAHKPAQSQSTTSSSSTKKPSPQTPVIPRPSRPHVRARDGELVPSPLSRPLGLPHPPQAGQNTGIDSRTWRQRRDDYASYDKHLARREGLIKELYEKNYFRDLGNVGRVHKGKSMLAPATPFRKEVALWFPNLRGRTLLGRDGDTTDVLRGRVSVVKVHSTDWGDRQCESFVGRGVNGALWELLDSAGVRDVAQMVEVQEERNTLKYWLVRMFARRMRKMKGERQWGRHFLVKSGFNDEIKENMGVWNSMIGYVYLLDAQCKIRWAGNGDAREEERQNIVKCLRRLVDEARGVQPRKVSRQEPRNAQQQRPADIEQDVGQQTVGAGAS